MSPQVLQETRKVVASDVTSKVNTFIADPSRLGYTSGFRIYPTYRDNVKWDILTGKARMDGNGHLWRIHDKLYDLTEFAARHPGGAWWITSTQGQDITELYESSHITDQPDKLLSKYCVGSATVARNSPFTFHENGFYRTLKRRVVKKLNSSGGAGPTWRTHAVMDGIVLMSFITGCLAAYFASIPLALLAGFVNHMVPACAHNLFHQRDSWRMYYVGLAQAMTVEEYRTFHVLSHHAFPNSVYDAEVFGLEPLLRMLTERSKTWYQRWLAPVIVSLLVVFSSTPFLFMKTAMRLMWGICFTSPEHLGTFAWWLVYYLMSGSISTATLIWVVMCHASSGCTLLLALASTHHHPEDYHDGDIPRQDKDWGLYQLDTTNDRPEYIGNFVLTSLLFGDHVLHHLFPTVDVSRLHQLYPILFDTCKEFDVPLRFYGQLEMVYHQFRQASNTVTQPLGPERHRFMDYEKTMLKLIK